MAHVLSLRRKEDNLMKETRTGRLVTSAVLLALATVLSLIRVYKLPLGGSVTLLSMLPVCLLSIRYGAGWGMLCSLFYGVILSALSCGELMSWGMTAGTWVGCLLFDYLLAYGSLGVAGLFRRHSAGGIAGGIGLAMVLRFVCHFISGTIFFAVWCPVGWNAALYSLCYNGSYMLPEMVFTMLGALALFRGPRTRSFLAGARS